MGFMINPYSPCVDKKMVNGKKYTVVWHVDDLKLSHMDEREVTKVISGLEGVYRKMRVKRVKKHDYICMDLGFRTKGK